LESGGLPPLCYGGDWNKEPLRPRYYGSADVTDYFRGLRAKPLNPQLLTFILSGWFGCGLSRAATSMRRLEESRDYFHST